MPSKGTSQVVKYRDEFIAFIGLQSFHADTMRCKTRYVDYFLAYLDRRGIRTLSRVNEKVLNDYKEYIAARVSAKTSKKYADGTAGMSLRAAGQFLKYLFEKGYVSKDIGAGFEIPKYRRIAPVVLSEGEMEQLLAAPDVATRLGLRDRALFEALYSTAIRRQELVNLNVSDVDLVTGTLRIKGSSASKERIVPLGRTAQRYVEKYLNEVRSHWVKDGSTSQALFIGVYKERLESVDCIIKRYGRKLYPGKSINSNTFRNSCAVHLLQHGAHLRAVQQLLGHHGFAGLQIYLDSVEVDLKKQHEQYHPRERGQ